MVTFWKTHYIPVGERLENRIEAVQQATINRPAIHGLTEYRSFALEGRSYRVPPLSYVVGDRLNALLQQWQRLSLSGRLHPAPDTQRATAQEIAAFLQRDAETTREWSQWTRDVSRICGRLIIPTYGVARWIHKLLRLVRLTMLFPNPLRRCSESELIAVLGFLHRCRTSAGNHRLRLGSHEPVV